MTTIKFTSFIYRYYKETDQEIEFNVDVEAIIQPEEKESWDSPGYPPYVELISVKRSDNGEDADINEDEEDELRGQAFDVAAERAEAAHEDWIQHKIDVALGK